MDFENPFAEEEEPEVIPNEPLLDYDNNKKEEDFNALVVLASKLENALTAQGNSESAALEGLMQNEKTLSQTVAQQRHVVSLRHRALQRIRHEQRQADATAHAATHATVDAVLSDLSSRLQEHEERSQKLEHSAGLYTQKLASAAVQTRARQTEILATQTADRPALLSAVLGERGDEAALRELEAPCLSCTDAAHVLECVDSVATHYMQQVPEQVAHTHRAEEVALALAAAQSVTDALTMVSAADAQVCDETQRARAAVSTLRALDTARLRLAHVLDQQQAEAALVASSPLPSRSAAPEGGAESAAVAVDLTRLECANESVRNDIRRLERALLSLTAAPPQPCVHARTAQPAHTRSVDEASTAMTTAVEMALHVAAMEQKEAQLDAEAAVLGKEVLRLRRWLAAYDETRPPTTTPPPLKKSKAEREVGLTSGPLSSTSAVSGNPDRLHSTTIDALSQLSRFLAVPPPLSSSSLLPSAAHSDTAQASASPVPPASNPFAAVLTAGLDGIAALQRECLGPLESIHAELRKQAFTASFLRRLARHGTDFCNPVVNRVLEGCAGWLEGRAQEVQEEVDGSCAMMASYTALEKKLTDLVHDSALTTARHSADPLAREHRQRFYQALIRCAVDDPALQSALEAQEPEEHGLAPLPDTTPLRLSLSTTAFEDALTAEVTDAEAQTREFVRESTQVLRERVGELRKKLTWFDKQTYTAPLRELYALHKQNDLFAEQLQRDEAAVCDDGTNATEQALQLRQSIEAQNREIQQMTERVEALRQRQAALSAAEDAALAFLRA